MLLQTNIIQNMLIDEGPSYQNLLIPTSHTTAPVVIDEDDGGPVIEDDVGAPLKDDGGGGRNTFSVDD